MAKLSKSTSQDKLVEGLISDIAGKKYFTLDTEYVPRDSRVRVGLALMKLGYNKFFMKFRGDACGWVYLGEPGATEYSTHDAREQLFPRVNP